MADLGRLERVDLREAWSSESGDFTPWLAQEGNLKLLGDTIGLDLELESQEVGVGPFRADLLCKDTATGRHVVVENQLEKTDHSHVGQLLTYAAGLDAVVIVWIAAQFTDEHRALLDWLNETTNEDIGFFGLEVEVWRIDGSRAAPKLNVVSRPNEWTRQVRLVDLTETQQLYVDYWGALGTYLKDHGSAVKPRKPLPQSWTDFSIGRYNFWLQAAANTQDKCVRVGLCLGGADALVHFRLLLDQRADIEAEVGASLVWEERPGRKIKAIWSETLAADPSRRADWPEQHAWAADQLGKLNAAFRERVRQLDATAYADGEGPP